MLCNRLPIIFFPSSAFPLATVAEPSFFGLLFWDECTTGLIHWLHVVPLVGEQFRCDNDMACGMISCWVLGAPAAWVSWVDNAHADVLKTGIGD